MDISFTGALGILFILFVFRAFGSGVTRPIHTLSFFPGIESLGWSIVILGWISHWDGVPQARKNSEKCMDRIRSRVLLFRQHSLFYK